MPQPVASEPMNTQISDKGLTMLILSLNNQFHIILDPYLQATKSIPDFVVMLDNRLPLLQIKK